MVPNKGAPAEALALRARVPSFASILAVIAALLAACTPGQIKPGETYRSKLGSFTCGPFERPTKVDEAFGPHGGTIRVVDEIGIQARVDIEEFSPPLQGPALAENLDALYKGYLAQNILPLVQSGVPGAKLLDARPYAIDGKQVLISAILMPEASSAFSLGPDRKRLDGIRTQVQYTNGRFMFTASRTAIAWSDKSPADQLDNAYKIGERAFKQCAFPP
jgi:hypothetical protein